MSGTESLRITSVALEGLFDVFNHRILLDAPERVTIIHGPNGFGKTMMLSMIHSFVLGNYGVFFTVPFRTFQLGTDNGGTITLIQKPKEAASAAKTTGNSAVSSCDVTYSTEGFGAPKKGSLRQKPQVRVSPQLMAELDKLVPGPFFLQGNNWLNHQTGERLDIYEIALRFPRVKRSPLYRRYIQSEASELDAVRERLSSYFIHTKRLLSDAVPKPRHFTYDDEDYNPEEAILSVDRYSRELVQAIEEKLADYGKHSQQLDRTFPVRLVEFLREERSPLEPDSILAQLAELDQRRQNLTRIGFLDPESVLENLGENDVLRAHEALSIYVQDMRNKLSVFDDIERRVTRFMDIINGRFNFKKLEVNRRNGFVVRPTLKSGSASSTIKLSDLSSGEQHELVVLSELLFKVPAGALILIDEPELSLHSAWQATFLDDLIGILEVNDARALVATHSPVIIGERWDLTQRLQAPISNEFTNT